MKFGAWTSRKADKNAAATVDAEYQKKARNFYDVQNAAIVETVFRKPETYANLQPLNDGDEVEQVPTAIGFRSMDSADEADKYATLEERDVPVKSSIKVYKMEAREMPEMNVKDLIQWLEIEKGKKKDSEKEEPSKKEEPTKYDELSVAEGTVAETIAKIEEKSVAAEETFVEEKAVEETTNEEAATEETATEEIATEEAPIEEAGTGEEVEVVPEGPLEVEEEEEVDVGDDKYGQTEEMEMKAMFSLDESCAPVWKSQSEGEMQPFDAEDALEQAKKVLALNTVTVVDDQKGKSMFKRMSRKKSKSSKGSRKTEKSMSKSKKTEPKSMAENDIKSVAVESENSIIENGQKEEDEEYIVYEEVEEEVEEEDETFDEDDETFDEDDEPIESGSYDDDDSLLRKVRRESKRRESLMEKTEKTFATVMFEGLTACAGQVDYWMGDAAYKVELREAEIARARSPRQSLSPTKKSVGLSEISIPTLDLAGTTEKDDVSMLGLQKGEKTQVQDENYVPQQVKKVGKKSMFGKILNRKTKA